MKKHYLLLSVLLLGGTLFQTALFAQRKPIPYKMAVYKSISDPFDYKNTAITVDLMIKNDQDSVIYSETQEAVLNDIAETNIKIGTGSNPVPPYDMVNMEKAHFLCYTAHVHTAGGDVIIMGQDVFGSNAFTLNADQSKNTVAIGGVGWGTENIGPNELYMPPTDIDFSVPVVRRNNILPGELPIFRQINLRNYVSKGNKPAAVNAVPVDFLCVGTGNPCPWLFGYKDITEIENFYTLYPGPMENFYNAFAVKVPLQTAAIGHSSAAIYAEHILDAQGVGVFANGLSRGSYNQGRTGSFGICNNTAGNGVGTWGYVLNNAAAGSGNYGVLGSSNGKTNAYAGYFDGDIYLNGNLMQPSDRKFKTDINTSSLGLSAVLQLRPAQYKYIQGSNFSFAKGEHFGFIAQELEEVIPGLVHDVIGPATLDPDLMSDGGTITFKGINYIELIPVLTKAIQELSGKLDAQSAEIAQLKDELKILKDKE